MFAPIVGSLLNTLVFVSFNPECHPFHSDPHLMHPTFSSPLALPSMFFFNLYIFWTLQQPLGCSAPIVKSKYNFTNGGYSTPKKMPFPWIYKTNLQQPLSFFLFLPNFLCSHYRLWANFDEMCFWINICEQPSTKRKHLNVES